MRPSTHRGKKRQILQHVSFHVFGGRMGEGEEFSLNSFPSSPIFPTLQLSQLSHFLYAQRAADLDSSSPSPIRPRKHKNTHAAIFVFLGLDAWTGSWALLNFLNCFPSSPILPIVQLGQFSHCLYALRAADLDSPSPSPIHPPKT